MNQAVKDGCLLNVEPLAVAHVAAVLADCSSALTSERATWLQLLTRPEPGG